MAEPFMGEIRVFSFVFAPLGWAMCNGQFLPINQNQALFSLLGTNYGGNGQTTFALPNLQSRVPIHMGQGHTLGEVGGQQSHTLTIAEIPAHIHIGQAANLPGDGSANPNTPIGNNLANATANTYAAATNLVAMAPNMITNAGGSQAHLNQQPFLTLNFCIALSGIFPSQN